MTNYIEFIRWCFSGISLTSPITRIVLYLVATLLGAKAFGSGPHWALFFSLAIAVDIMAMMIAWKYQEFKREKRDGTSS